MPITAITINGQSIAGQTISASLAGQPFAVVGDKPSTAAVVYLYGPGRTTPGPNVPNSAYIAGTKLPPQLAAGNYTFRVRYQGEPDSAYFNINFKVSAASTTNTVPPVVVTPPPLIGGANSDEPKRGTFTPGVVDYDGKSTVPASGLLTPFKFQRNRIWHDAGNFTSPVVTDRDRRAIDTKRTTGARPIWMIGGQPVHKATLGNAPGYFVALIAFLIAYADADQRSSGMTIDVEVFNEVDLTTFFDGNFDDYLAALAAISTAVRAKHGNRVRLISCGLSYQYQWIINNVPKIAPYVDAIGFHGYPHSANAAAYAPYVALANLCKSLGKPLVLSEWGLGFGEAYKAATDKAAFLTTWAAAVPGFVKFIIDLASSTGITIEGCWYSAYNTNNSTNAAQALVATGANGQLALTPFGVAVFGQFKASGVI